MNATPRSARLSSTGQVVAILVGSAVASLAILIGIITLFVAVVIPGLEFGGKDQIPPDLPVYPGARLDSAFASGFQGCITVTATWSSSAPASQVIDFYQSQLNTGGWTVTDTSRRPGEFDLGFESTSGLHREGMITVFTGGGNATTISLNLIKSSSLPTSASECHILIVQTG